MKQQPATTATDHQLTLNDAESQVWQWLDDVVIGLNLCPFAKKPRQKQQIKVRICDADNDQQLITDFMDELEFIRQVDANETDTSVFVITNLLADFDRYLDYLALANMTISQMGLEGDFQLASFHPQYQFEGTLPSDKENLTNTAPFPIIHIIREATVEKVLKLYPNPELIPEHNINRVEALSDDEVQRLYPFLSQAVTKAK